MLTSTTTINPRLNKKLSLYSSNSVKTKRAATPLAEILLAMDNWYKRIDFWKEEFDQCARLVQLHLNELPKHTQVLKQNYFPIKAQILEKLPLLELELEHLEADLKNDLLFISGIKNPRFSWQRVEKELLAFESEHNANRRRFIDMISQALPLKIF